jgi:MATE family multidrug resistance protein
MSLLGFLPSTFLRYRPLLGELVRLSWPIVVSTLSFSAMTLVDTLFVGRLGPAALAATGLGGVAAFLIVCFGIGLLRAVKVSIAQARGAGRDEETLPSLGAGLVLGAGFGVIAIGIGWVASLYLPALATSRQAGALAGEYLWVRSLAAPMVLVTAALREARYGWGDTRSPMNTALIANVAHVPLDALFIFGFEMGVVGAAWATMLSQSLELALLVAIQRRTGFGLRAFASRHLGRILRLGVPIGTEFVLSISAFSALVALIARMTEVDLAAHHVALQIIHFSFMPALAIGEAASVLTGNAVGAEAYGEVRRVGYAATSLACLYTGACATTMLIAAHPLVSLFSSAPEVQALAVRLLYVSAAFQVFDGAGIVARGVLRGAGDVRFAAWVTVIAAWVCTPPLTLVLGFWMGLGALGGWLGIFAEIMASTAVLWWRLERGHWLRAARRARAELDDAVLAPVSRPAVA